MVIITLSSSLYIRISPNISYILNLYFMLIENGSSMAAPKWWEERLCGLAGSVLDHRLLPPCSNLGGGISEGCFIFDFASLPLEVPRPI